MSHHNETYRPPREAVTGGRSHSSCNSDGELKWAADSAETLLHSDVTLERIAASRSWSPKTLRELALEPSLGFYDGKLAFLYETGVKLRWQENGQRVIKWAFGKPSIWRNSALDTAQSVYLCEGETDAISLIDSGVEAGSESAAVALPSATTFQREWAKPFVGKDVILAFDNDEAGRKATQRISNILHGAVRSLNWLNWEGAQNASCG